MQHASHRVRRHLRRDPDPVVRRADAATLAVGLVCTWVYVGLLVVDGERMVSLLTWPFLSVLIAIAAARIGTRLVRRRRAARALHRRGVGGRSR